MALWSYSQRKDAYYAMRGWDSFHGWPTPQKLRTLGLDEFIPQVGW